MTTDSNKHATLDFLSLSDSSDETIAILSLNRERSANAFSAQMMAEITDYALQVKKTSSCRLLCIVGRGRHFSAGADLEWMKSAAGLSLEQNIEDASRLKDMFESVAQLPIPKIAFVKGAAYGGAVGLVAVCDYVVASDDAKFCLSETKLGLLPAVIAPYLGRKINLSNLNRCALTGMVFSSSEAHLAGLVASVVPADQWHEKITAELAQLLSAGKNAQSSFVKLLASLRQDGFAQSVETVKSIAHARVDKEAQEGLASFLLKQKPNWIRSVPTDFNRFLLNI